ncbi:PAS domain S-box [Rivularia sp. PCC 7116]|uniref:hybrid sensor histidine kinase/response regulator n=1 Tax=Rivularia sp. PCC 7116 TaxID=373994 RepID=UPI00029EC525|nr:hybrid sensor histidine kinase/response regulator [Rivularia sp. PCC 7116]AFY55844.1 PAS domain S-box [Rivularia sp. PCC 7116]
MLHILLLEDDSADCELIRATLKNGGINCNLKTVATRQAFLAELQNDSLDLILSDYSLPQFDGISALKLAQETCSDVPFILVSGVLGEERAIEAVKDGATDYVLKQRLERLVPSVKRALRESLERQALKRTEESLRQTNDMLRAVVQASPVAIVTLSLDYQVLTWNKTAEQIYGWKAFEILHQKLPVIPENSKSAFSSCVERVIQNQTLKNLEFCHLKKDGSEVDINVSLAPIHDNEGNSCCFIMTAVDITLSKQIEAERRVLLQREQKARADAEKASRIKDEFLAIVSHELRTPLNAILGWTKLINSGRIKPERFQQALEVIDRNATLQAQLIEDLLDISRIIRGQLHLELNPVNLADVIKEAVETLHLAAEAKSIRVELNLDENVRNIVGDSNRISQVMWNLVSNAIKFTDIGGIVEISLQEIGSNAQVQISDTGIGIDEDFIDSVFEYFRQADGSTTRSQGGLGLGLAITRNLVEAHGGNIQVESAGVGLGTVFTVNFPIIPSDAAQSESAQLLGNSHQQLSSTKILVVDDEPDARELVAFILEEQGAEIEIVGSAKEALRKLERFVPDLLISDIGMPGEDGFSLLSKIRKLAGNKGGNVAAIALTAFATQQDYKNAIEAGFQAHLAKPFDADELINLVINLSPKTR